MSKPQELDIFSADLRPMQFWHVKAEEKLATWETGQPEGYSTGFSALDKMFRLVNSDLLVIAARPSAGKTALGMQMVENLAKQMRRNDETGCVAVFSAEMSGWSLYLRMAAAMCGVNTYKLSINDGAPGDSAKLRTAMEELRELPIWIDDSTSPSTSEMLTQLHRLNESIPVRAMMFDFLELGAREQRQSSEEQRISAIAVNLKGIAKTLDIPVIALSQLSRGVEERANKMPMLADLRYSGMIEQIADKIAFIMRPEYYIERGMSVDAPAEDLKGVAYVQVAKHRNGPVGLAKLSFQKEAAKFGNLSRERKELNEY
jgi:replicative DNA helicase